jgi:hypothetical protein
MTITEDRHPHKSLLHSGVLVPLALEKLRRAIGVLLELLVKALLDLLYQAT